MRMNEERVRLIHKRTEEIKEENRKKKQRILDSCCIVACLVLVVGIGAFMPGLVMSALGGVSHTSGAASLIGNHAALTYILMGLLCFLLGVSVTVLLYRLHRREKCKRQEGDRDEKL